MKAILYALIFNAYYKTCASGLNAMMTNYT